MKALAMHFDNKSNLTTNYSDIMNYAMDVCGSSYDDTKLTCVSRQEKQVVFYELRQWKKPFSSIQLDHGPKTSCNKHICIKVSELCSLYKDLLCVLLVFSTQ